jgi:aminopeptidase N
MRDHHHLVTMLVLLSAVGCSDAAASNADSIDVLHYDVKMAVDLERATIEGSTQIDLRVQTRAQSALQLSRSNLAIDEVLIGGRKASARVLDDAVVIDLPARLRKGQRLSVTIKYNGKPARGLLMANRSAYTSYFTCDWMMCALDHVGDKASLRLELLTPIGMTTYGPGKLVTRAVTAAGLQRHVWYESRPYSPYVYGFALGEFNQSIVHSERTKLVYASTEVPAERLQELFAPTADMLRFFEAKAGVPFPHPSYLQILVSGSAAQEALNFSVIGQATLAPMMSDPQDDWVIAHELAHQWWGNAVTCIDLSHFWLNEGITTFMVAAWKEHRWGRHAYERELALLRSRVDRAREAGADHPLAYAGRYESLALRRSIQYSKGALFMDRLREELGDDVFWRALKSYTRHSMGDVVSSRDLQRNFERVAKRSLAPLFDEWVY